MSAPPRIDLEQLRERLSAAEGRQFWRGLEEVAGTDEFREFLHREFPRDAAVMEDAGSRRDFLRLAAASLAFGGLYGCSKQPPEKILPYAEAPENVVPGKPLFYASAFPFCGVAQGVLVESHMGRPTKIEGNPDHPASLGASSAFAQASILELYDPDRAQVVSNAGRVSSWSAFRKALAPEMALLQAGRGKGLRVLTGAVTSPTLAAQLQALQTELPEAAWHSYEAGVSEAGHQGTRLAFGEELDAVYRFDRAEVVLALDSDFMTAQPGSVRYAKDFAARRRVNAPGQPMNRLYALESTPTATGSIADHRWPVTAREVETFVRDLAAELGLLESWTPSGRHAARVTAVVAELRARRGSCVVVPGEWQTPAVHALAHALNQALGAVGRTVEYITPVRAPGAGSLPELRLAMDAGEVEVLVILGCNPVFDRPGFAAAMDKVRLRVRLGIYEDETSYLCHWHVPQAHYLEGWTDLRGHDGTLSVGQPLIAPLYRGRTAHEMLAALAGQPDTSAYELVRAHWRGVRGEEGFENWWRRTLHDGLAEESASPARTVRLRRPLTLPQPRPAQAGLELGIRPDPCVWDGRWANHGWLQETPKPITKLTWDNAALFSPADAQELGLENGAIVTLELTGRKVDAPVWILPGQAAGAVTVHMGYGRTRAGRVGNGAGFHAERLKPGEELWFAAGLTVAATGRSMRLASTQAHHSMEGRGLVREATLAEFARNPDFATADDHEVHSLIPGWDYEGYKWGMAVDLNSCIGCNACMVACQSENNVPVVGKEQVLNGREMHWIRIDRYFEGGLDAPRVLHQPVMCQHCETAPCEVVCPVAATVHDEEGLNVMVYNRCVGTRYCSNNCPYKVRRFNFLEYNGAPEPVVAMGRNPDVTVRARGVMEKCSYCVQRISAARIEAGKEGRPIRDGEVKTACQSACPSDAIAFGDLNDPTSRIAAARKDPRSYALLGGIGTKPRTEYQARLSNPDPALEDEA